MWEGNDVFVPILVTTVVEVDDIDEILVVSSSGCVCSNDSLTT
jgi:hypothetical protein